MTTKIELVLDTCNFCIPKAGISAIFALSKLDRIIEAHGTDHDKVVVMGSSFIPIQIGSSWFFLDEDVNISTATHLDTGSISNGKQYYVYACNNNRTLVFMISLNATYPSGFTANTSRKIGGFHTLCVNVGTISGHTLTGYLASDILPASIWDLKHRPICEPSGMVFDEGISKWVDIYLASSTGGTTASVYNATITDARDWMDFVDDGHAVRKRLLSDDEFQSIAAGSNEETNILGSADPVTTGGHSDTGAQRMISNIGCEDCAGVMYQWLRDQSAMYDNAVVAGWYNLAGAKGSLYRPVDTNDVKLRAGGYWGVGTSCGSRCRHANSYRWYPTSTVGARFLAEPL